MSDKENEVTSEHSVGVTEKTTAKFNGYIDLFENGVIKGWAVNLNDLDSSVMVQVICDSKIIGVGLADVYRKDIEVAGFGNGKHGFEIFSAIDWPVDSSSITLNIIEAESGLEINSEPRQIAMPEQMLFATILREDQGNVVILLESSEPLGKKQINLFHEDEMIARLDIDTEETELEVRLPLPLIYLDGRPRLYKVGMTGIPNLLGMDMLSCHAIKTPWECVKESFNKPGFLSRSPQANSRYESLQYQLEARVNGCQSNTYENLLITHSVVVEGYEGRNKYPKFSLPVFDKPEVSIIVPAYNQFELTYHCIASIALAFNKTSYEVILADDNSTDETAQAEEFIGNLVVSRNSENVRFLHNCNRASEKAQSEYIIFLNNDTEVTSFWIDELIAKHKEDDAIGMTGSKLINLDGTLQEAGSIVWKNGEPKNVGRDVNPLTPEYNYAREVDYLAGAAMCIRSDIWREVGLFSEELAPCYYEDTDLAFKVREAGYKTVYVPHSVVVHFEGMSHGTHSDVLGIEDQNYGVDTTKSLKRNQIVNESVFRQKWIKAYRNNGSPSAKNIRFEKDRNIEQRVLVIDYASPMPNKDAGSYAAVQEMKLIQSLGFKVTFVPANMAHFGKFTTNLQKMGVEVLHAPFYHSVNHVLETRLDEFDVIYITRYQIAKEYIDYIRANSSAKIIFNNADLHFLREMRAALRSGINQEALDRALETREQELQVCKKVDAILCYNNTEHAVITSHILEAEKLHLTPWVLEEKTQGLGFKERDGIAFLGGYNHTPNKEAVEYLVSEIMPLLELQRPDITLYVYGSNMPKHFKESESETIKMVGFAETLDGVYHNHRVFVAPLLSGAGIKGKVLESMAYNLPTVLSEVAVEGTGLTHGISTLIAEEAQEWVDAIIKLYDDECLWNTFAKNSQVLVEAKYSFEHGHKVFKNIFASVGIYSSK